MPHDNPPSRIISDHLVPKLGKLKVINHCCRGMYQKVSSELIAWPPLGAIPAIFIDEARASQLIIS